MSEVHLDYRHCDRKRPSYLKHAEVEQLAGLVRLQLVDQDADAMPFEVLTNISHLRINGVNFDLYVGTAAIIHDEDGSPVLGVCEFDPGVPDAVMVSVSPTGELASQEVALSTLAHEMGHAIFDAPAWIVDASMGPGLFDAPDLSARKAYRTTTRDDQHLNSPHDAATESPRVGMRSINKAVDFAEFRANEFMGSLLVPRQRLIAALEETAPKFGIALPLPRLLGQGCAGTANRRSQDLEGLQKTVAKRFGVHRRFIEVRMARYGLTPSGTERH